ncbi:UDP-N-acetylmuramate--L-alanine ligase [Bombiscardovia nodaiensis]|uniref:UDP-N-acetylmuramate--L-alanine ligase n=1 Tax=Bombiscardovia nodaiensis TaxID=2932181 RepID=A0ABM8B9K2_9BIFI|nr:UDP-N-acetylmuramate--L-alanine ligase [Bombiscardovia nodaiensis]
MPALHHSPTPAASPAQLPALDPTVQAFTDPGQRLDSLGHTHFIGIGGAGMSVLAQMLKQAGLDVSGSDQQASAKTAELESMGIPVAIGQAADHVRGAQTVVWSSAIKSHNPEILAARAQGSTLVHRSDILALLLASHVGVTVAGAHGKTTTSALLAHILRLAGRGETADPSYAIGGSIQSLQGPQDGGHLGSGRVLVAEADESDGSFEKYHPSIAVITNVEPDHLDHYGSPQAFQEAFAQHARHAQGSVIISGDDQGSRQLLTDLRGKCQAEIVVYTTASEKEVGQEGWDTWAQVVRIMAEQESQGSGQEQFTLKFPQGLSRRFGLLAQDGALPVQLAIPGLHNARNAAAAMIAACGLGLEPAAAAQAAASFLGAARRFEVKGSVHGVSLVDDYAHHPTEIAALLAAARRRYPQAQLRVLFQPHLFSRTQIFAREFASALAAADDVIVTGVFPARELQSDFPDIGPQTIVQAFQELDNGQDSGRMERSAGRFEAVSDMNRAARRLAERAQAGDVLLTVGAGDITRMGPVILQALAEGSSGAQEVGEVAGNERL